MQLRLIFLMTLNMTIYGADREFKLIEQSSTLNIIERECIICFDEKEEGNNLYKTCCCNQLICRSCFNKIIQKECPYCRATDKSSQQEKDSNSLIDQRKLLQDDSLKKRPTRLNQPYGRIKSCELKWGRVGNHINENESYIYYVQFDHSNPTGINTFMQNVVITLNTHPTFRNHIVKKHWLLMGIHRNFYNNEALLKFHTFSVITPEIFQEFLDTLNQIPIPVNRGIVLPPRW